MIKQLSLLILLVSTFNCQYSFDSSKIKVITFDLFAALTDLYANLEISVPKVLDNVPHDVAVQLSKTWIGQYGPQMQKAVETETLSRFDVMLRNGLKFSLDKHGINATEEQKLALYQTWCQLVPYPEVKEVMETLQERGYKVAMLSNGDTKCLNSESHFITGSEEKGAMDYFFSSEIKHHVTGVKDTFKTDLPIYSQTWLSEQVDFDKTEVVHVNGAKGDGLAAIKYGMNSIWHNRTNENISGYSSIILTNLKQLLTIFKGYKQEEIVE